MPAINHNAKLNDLLIELGRSLLQYSAETGVWAASSAAEQKLISAAVRQQADVARLLEFLADRGWPIDNGTYPTDFTDLQFLSLKYVLPRIIEEQRGLVDELDEAVHTCIDDPDAVAVLRDVLDGERQVLSELAALSQPTPVAGA